jgi:hypothetical protein
MGLKGRPYVWGRPGMQESKLITQKKKIVRCRATRDILIDF